MANNELFLDAAKHLRGLAEIFESVVAEDKKPEPAKSAEKKVGLEDVRAVLGLKSQAGLTAEVRALITKFGGSKLSDVPQDQYAALLKEAEGLGNG